MISAIKKILHAVFAPAVYVGGSFIALYSIVKDAWWGFLFFAALIPQPNVWHKFFGLPFGKDFMDILFFAIFLGIFLQKKKIPKTSNTVIIVIFLVVTYLSLWVSSANFGLPYPISHASSQLYEWKNFAQMILIYFLVIALAKEEKKQEILFILLAIVILFMVIRNYRNFTAGASFHYGKRVGGPFEAVDLGATHYGAFIAHFSVAFLGMAFFEKEWKKRLLYLTTFVFCLYPLFFSYSRGAYAGAAVALAFFGLRKRILLLILLFLFVTWKVVLPPSVVDRISMTETPQGQLESSAESRLKIWAQAESIISENLIFGAGWESYGLIIPRDERIHNLTDTHNYYVKSLCDRGIIGLFLLLGIFYKAFISGFKLYRIGNNQFQKGLGFGFMGTVLACMVTNMFGDRFTYFVMGSYFWLLWGLVDSVKLTIGNSNEIVFTA